ncbi:MAG TPA: hypothetical protein VMB47_15935 [Candidatus Aquilonibacter sp.]|nr:hypothetical protein [Candidatus Aquilonibacter sp.]
MTKEEKAIVTDMSNLICEMMLRRSVVETILAKYVPDWPLKVASVISSPEHQKLQKENQKLQRSIELLIEQNNLTSLRSLLPNNGRTN